MIGARRASLLPPARAHSLQAFDPTRMHRHVVVFALQHLRFLFNIICACVRACLRHFCDRYEAMAGVMAPKRPVFE